VRESLAYRIREVAQGAEVGAATAAEVDAIGIVAATFLAMRRALDLLRGAGLLPSLVLVDAVRVPGLEIAQRAYVRGDGRVAAIAAASIVAKVARDARMDELERRFPIYGFGSHRGYGTPEHLAALRRYGPCPEHRLTFDRVVVRRGAPKAA
jgi:ribonuclease HII